MKIDTKDVEQLEMLRQTVMKTHTVTAVTDQKTTVRISIVKNAPTDVLDSLIAADEVFDVRDANGHSVVSEFEFFQIGSR